MTKNAIITAIPDIVETAFKNNLTKIPYRTGNLRYNATSFHTGENILKITIDEQIAPYAEHVNLVGKSKGYWDRFYDGIVSDLRVQLENKSPGGV